MKRLRTNDGVTRVAINTYKKDFNVLGRPAPMSVRNPQPHKMRDIPLVLRPHVHDEVLTIRGIEVQRELRPQPFLAVRAAPRDPQRHRRGQERSERADEFGPLVGSMHGSSISSSRNQALRRAPIFRTLSLGEDLGV